MDLKLLKCKRIFCLTIFILFCLSVASCTVERDTDSELIEPSESPVLPMPSATLEVSSDFFADSADNLEKFASYSDGRHIIIDGNITLTEDIIFTRAVDIEVRGAILSDGYSLIVRCYETIPVNIEVLAGSTVSDGAIIIDCPYSDLTWKGGCVPNLDFVLENMNVRSFNGTNLRERIIGGTGIVSIRDIIIKNDDGTKIFDTDFTTVGNVITLSYPFEKNENLLRKSYLDVVAENCCKWEITDMKGNSVDTLTLYEKFILTLIDTNGEKRGYYIKITRVCKKIPVVSIYTVDDSAIDSKEIYTKGSISIDCSGSDKYRNFSFYGKALGIKGRGNASWKYTDKKSYRLKFDEKVSVLGMEPDKDWVLVSNYYDKSLMRNIVAHELAKTMENLEYTPTHIPIDLFINGEYRGVYTIADKIEVSNEKIDIDVSESTENAGFLVEVGWDYFAENIYGKDYFDTDTVKRIYVKEPDITTKYSEQMREIMTFVRNADAAIVSGSGYEEYIDIDSMVDWFIIAELTNNTEMAFYRSCYFYKPAGGKIKMGPVWDFDMAFGNHRGDISDYDGWATAEAEYVYVNDTWTTYLLKSQAFLDRVKTRWNEKKESLLNVAEETIYNTYSAIRDSSVANFIKWNILDKQIGEGNVDFTVYSTYEKQVEYVREFLFKRAEWITNRLNKS